MKLVFITQQVDPGASRARRDGPEDRARSRGSWTRSSCSRTARSRTSCRRTAACGRSAPRTRPGAARASRPRSPRELRGLRGGAVVAHMCPIYAVLAAPLVRPLRVPLVLWFTHWRASRLLRAAERVSTAVVVASTAARSRSRRGRCARSGTGSTSTEFPCAPPRATATACGCSRSAATRRRRGSTSCSRALAAVDDGVRLDVHGPALSEEERMHRAELERLVAGARRSTAACVLGDAGAASRDPGAAREPRRAREQHARGRARQGRLRGRRQHACPVLASNPVFDSLLDRRAALPALRPAASSPTGSARSRRSRPHERAALGKRLREQVEESHSVESWARGVLEAAGLRMTDGSSCTRRRSPASRARRRTCSSSCPTSASAAGTSAS